jgi:hypothetical protein
MTEATETAETENETLAETEAVEAEPTATVRLKDFSTGKKHTHPLGINGRIRHLTVGEDETVTAGELAVLEASDVAFDIVTPLPQVAGEEAASGSAASSETAEELPPSEEPS